MSMDEVYNFGFTTVSGDSQSGTIDVQVTISSTPSDIAYQGGTLTGYGVTMASGTVFSNAVTGVYGAPATYGANAQDNAIFPTDGTGAANESFDGIDNAGIDLQLANGNNIDIYHGINQTGWYYQIFTGTAPDVIGNLSLTNFSVSPGNSTIPCYRAGTRILTPSGEVCIEDLAAGDLVMTRDHGARPIIWLGHRLVDCQNHPAPHNVWPVRVQRGAFADAVPARDLYLSPHHTIFCDGVLIEAKNLINGASITQIPCDSVEYWHLELAAHDILLAEGLPAESYLDTGNRHSFGGGEALALHPDFAPKHWAETCVPLVFGGEDMQRTREKLLARAEALGYRLTADDDVHVLADGKRIDPIRLNAKSSFFVLPENAAHIELRSRSFVPVHAQPASTDTRTLGLCLKRVQLDGADMPLDDDSLCARGWSHHERPASGPAQRWTTGATPLPPGTRLIIIDHAGPGYYWAPGESQTLTLVA
jgi:hypothetical protein